MGSDAAEAAGAAVEAAVPLIDNQPAADPRRFYGLGVFFLVCFVTGLEFTALSTIPEKARGVFPGLSNTAIFWSLNMGPITSAPMTVVCAWLLKRPGGMRVGLRVAAACNALCTALRVVAAQAPESFRAGWLCTALLMVAGALCGIAGPFTQGTPSRFSAEWFPPAQRTRATAVCILGTSVGFASGFLINPVLVPSPDGWPSADDNDHDAKAVALAKGDPGVLRGFRVMAWVQLGIACVPALLSFAHFPHSRAQVEHVPDEPKAGGGLDRATVRFLARNGPFVTLLFANVAIFAFYGSWQNQLAMLVPRLGTQRADQCAFAGVISNIAGGYLMGEVGDRWLQRRFREAIIALGIALLCFFVTFNLQVELLRGSFHPIPKSAVTEVASVTLSGLCFGAITPLVFELAAELTHPLPEQISGLAINLMQQAGSIVSLGLFPALPDLAVAPTVFGALAVSFAALSCVRGGGGAAGSGGSDLGADRAAAPEHTDDINTVGGESALSPTP